MEGSPPDTSNQPASRPHSMAVLISGRGSNLQSIIDAAASHRLNARLSVVISNVEGATGLDRAQEASIPARCVPHVDHTDRPSFELALTKVLREYDVQWIVLAGFMRILTEDFVSQWHGRLLNIHPSLLPLYPGLNTHQRALDAKDSHAGASVHFVTPQLDGGPVILQGMVDVESNDTAGKLAERGLKVEHVIYPLALEWLTSNRIRLGSSADGSQAGSEQVIMDGQPLTSTPRWYRGTLENLLD